MPALSRRPAGLLGAWAKLFNWFVRAHAYYFSLPRLKFEAMTLGLAAAFRPARDAARSSISPAIYVLKPYANGGVFALYVDFFKGLVELRPSCWIALAGPFVFLSLFRIFRLILRKL